MVTAPGELGELGILPRHSQLLTRLKPGQVRVRLLGGENSCSTCRGIAGSPAPCGDYPVRYGGTSQDLDEVAAQSAKQRAEQVIADSRSEFEFARAKVELAEAIAQLQTIAKMRKQRKSGLIRANNNNKFDPWAVTLSRPFVFVRQRGTPVAGAVTGTGDLTSDVRYNSRQHVDERSTHHAAAFGRDPCRRQGQAHGFGFTQGVARGRRQAVAGP